jgi:hypothetical protein
MKHLPAAVAYFRQYLAPVSARVYLTGYLCDFLDERIVVDACLLGIDLSLRRDRHMAGYYHSHATHGQLTVHAKHVFRQPAIRSHSSLMSG